MLIDAQYLTENLKRHKDQGYDMLLSIVCADISEDIESVFELTYILYSTKLKNRMYIKVQTNGVMPSVCRIYKSANFEEREIYDLFGVYFDKHPDLERILMIEGSYGHPLRKDYTEEDARLAWRK